MATNCSGTNAMRYGTMKDWVVNLTVVLADGNVIKTRRRPRKTSAGYNLTSLFVGAEGTLGMVTEVTLKLAPIPQDTSVAIVSFPTIKEAATAASSIIRSGIQLAALEVSVVGRKAYICLTGLTFTAVLSSKTMIAETRFSETCANLSTYYF